MPIRFLRPLSWAAIVAVLAASIFATSVRVTAAGPAWGEIVGPVTATSLGVRMPTTLAEVRTLTSADEAAIRSAVLSRMPEVMSLVDAGVVRLDVKTAPARPPSVSLPNGSASLNPVHLYQDAQCLVAWVDYPASGTAVRGGGWTRSNSSAYVQLYNGHFYKDGAFLGSFGSLQPNSTNAESYTAWDWRAWWEPTHSYFTESDHEIDLNGGGVDWGPWHCTVQAFK